MARTTPVNSGYTIINGSSTGSNASYVDTWLEYKVTGQSVANNTSTVRLVLYSMINKSSSTKREVAENFGYVGYDNGNKQYLSTTYDFSGNRINKFGDYTYTISHNSDGTKTLTLQGSWSTPYSSYISGGSVSGQVTLPRIARASTISSLSTRFGSAGTISITRQSSDFTHTLTYAFGSVSGTIATTTTSTSVSWTPDVSLINQLGTNDSSGIGTITCTTFSGNTPVGTSTSTLTLTIPNSSLGNVSGTYGSALTLTASNACSSGLTYTFAYYNGSSWQGIASTTNKTQSWTPNTSLIGNVSNSASGTVSVRVITYRGTTPINTATATATLTIPKNTSSAVSGTIGTALSIPVTKSYSGLTSTITYAFGSTSGTIATTTSSTSQSWTPPTSLLTQIPNSTVGIGNITVATYNGTALVGANSYGLTLSANASVVPTSSLSLTRVNTNSTVNGWGIYLQGYSQVRATLTGNGVNGSTIKSMSIGGTGLSSSSSPSTTSATLTGTSSVLQTSGTLTYTGNVSDSRNRSATQKTQSISVVAYSQPSVSGVSLARSNSSGTLDTSGTYLKVGFTLNYSSASGHNSASVSLRYKESSASSWTTYGTVTNGANLNLNLDVSKNYQAQLLASDSLNSNIASATFNIPSAERVLNVNGSGSGLAIGGFSTDAGKLQVYYPADFEGNTLPTINEKNYISYYTDTHISATNYNSIEAFYDALPSSVQTSVWCETATDRPMASGGMVTVFKEDNSYGYVVFHGTGGDYFTKRKTGGVWQQWFAMASGSISGNDITLSQKLIGNFTGNFTSWQSFAYSVSGNIKSNWKGFLKTAIDNLQSQLANGSYVIQLSWSGQTWGQAYVTISNDVPYAMLKWMPPFEGWFSCAYYNGGYNYKYVPTTTDNRIFDAYGSTKQLTSEGTITLHSISLPQGVYLFEGFASPTAISGDQKFELYFPTMATHREGVWSRSNTIVYMNIQSVIAISSDNTSIAMAMYSSAECTITNIHIRATALYLGNP